MKILFACQVEFTECKSSHAGTDLTQRPYKASKELPADYKVPLLGTITVTHITQSE